MSNSDQVKELEEQFKKLKESTSAEDWKDPEHLKSVARSLEDTNLALSVRVLQRVKHLRKLEQNRLVKKIKRQSKMLDDDDLIRKDISTARKKAQKRAARNEASQTKGDSASGGEASEDELVSLAADKDSKKKLQTFLKKPIIIFVVFPLALFAFYQIVWASPRYESQSKIIVKQPDSAATLDAGMAILSGLGVKPTGTDAKLVEEYIYSSDMLDYLQRKLSLKEHYSSAGADFFSKLDEDASKESFLAYYKSHVTVEIDDNSEVITLYVQGFTPEFAQNLNKAIVDRAEWFINEISRNLANEQLKFVKEEHKVVEERLKKTQLELIDFQRQHQLLDPEAEGAAFQKIAYTIEGKIAEKESELKALQNVMSDDSALVKSVKNQINALEEQLEQERERLSSSANGTSVSEVLARFSDFKIDLELALKAYSSSQLSLEKSRIESYRQIKYLVVVEAPTLAEDNRYPNIIYNLSLCAVVLLMLFGIGAILYSTANELT